MTALDPGSDILHSFDNHFPTPIPSPHDTRCNRRFLYTEPLDITRKYKLSPTMMSIPRALRPASRRILSAHPVVASAVPARWQHSNNGPFDPIPGHEMGVGELEGAKFRIEPLRRTGEDAETMRARLTCT